LTENGNAAKRAIIAQDICNSEAFARLMVGVNTVDDEIQSLRERWHEYLDVNGGYGKSRERSEES